MGGVQIGKHHARFPADFKVPRWLAWMRASLFRLNERSRLSRAVSLAMPPSRMRMFFIGHYMRYASDATNDGSMGPLTNTVAADAEWTFFGGDVYTGPAGWERAVGQLDELFQNFVWVVDEVLCPPGTNLVACLGEISGEGGLSGAPVTSPWCFVVEMERGMAVRAQNYTSRAEALQAVGLEG